MVRVRSVDVQAAIYRIVHVKSGRSYVGHTAKGTVHRFREHRYALGKGTHSSPHLQYAWNQYGPEAFAFEVVERCRFVDRFAREQFWIDSSDSRFNAARFVAGSRLGIPQPYSQVGRRLSEETKAKIAAGNRIPKPTSRFVRTLELRARIGASLRQSPAFAASLAGRQHHSEETRAKMRGAQRKRWHG